MTTPRVTVPPHALEAIAFNLCSLHDFDVAFVRENERFATSVITEYVRTLSAAPAPEGGAVSIWSDARSLFVRYAELFAMTERYEEASAIADKAAREIETLATREEAPAEAGVQETLRVLLDNLVIAQSLSKELRQRATDEARSYLSALRAQPPAREDALPVAKPAPFNPGGIGHAMYQAFNVYLADYVLSTDGADYEPTPFERDLIEDFFAGLMAEEAFFGPVRALYDTHPAPDALRAAEEALEAIKEVSGDRAASGYNETGRLARINERCDQALAALQQDALSAAPGEAGE